MKIGYLGRQKKKSFALTVFRVRKNGKFLVV